MISLKPTTLTTNILLKWFSCHALVTCRILLKWFSCHALVTCRIVNLTQYV